MKSADERTANERDLSTCHDIDQPTKFSNTSCVEATIQSVTSFQQDEMKASRMKLENVNVTAFKKLNIRKANFDLTTVAENFVNIQEADKAL